MKKIAVFTAIFGEMDNLLEPKCHPDNVDFICFTEQDIQSEHWQIRKKQALYDQPVRDSRRYKTLPHRYLSEYDVSIWIDGTFLVTKDVNYLVEKYLSNSNMACFSHNQTTLDPHKCIYNSANYILMLGEKNYNLKPEKGIAAYKDDPKLIVNQMNRYKKEGYPEGRWLAITGIVLRRHNEQEIINIDEAWWSEIKYESHICQLSLPYVCWKHNFEPNWIPGDIRNNDIIVHQGKHKRKILEEKYGYKKENTTNSYSL